MNLQNPLLPGSEMPSDGNFDQTLDDVPASEEEMVAKPKRPRINGATLLLFGLLAAVGGATYLMILRAGAQIHSPSAATAAADSTISTFLTGGVQNFRQNIALLQNTEKVVGQFNSSPAECQVPLSGLRVNPFVAPQVKVEAQTPLSDAAARLAEEKERAAGAEIAGKLKLQSILRGPHSICMIDGKSYLEGKGNGVFIVEQIQPQSAVVRIGTQRFEIKMSPPRQD